MSSGVGGIFSSFSGGVSHRDEQSDLKLPSWRECAKKLRDGLRKAGSSIQEVGDELGGPLGSLISGVGKKMKRSVEPTFKERCKTFFGAVGWSILGVLAVAGTVAIAPVLFIFVAIPAAIAQKERGLLVSIPLAPIIIAPGYCFLSAFNKELRDKLVNNAKEAFKP